MNRTPTSNTEMLLWMSPVPGLWRVPCKQHTDHGQAAGGSKNGDKAERIVEERFRKSGAVFGYRCRWGIWARWFWGTEGPGLEFQAARPRSTQVRR